MTSDSVLRRTLLLYRNFRDIPFMTRCSELQREQINIRTRDTFAEPLMRLNSLEPAHREQLTRSLLLTGTTAQSCILLRRSPVDCTRAVCTNCAEHLLFTAVSTRIAFPLMAEELYRDEEQVAAYAPFSFYPRYGYLLADTRLTGTGLQASALLHLPYIEKGEIDRIRQQCSEKGLRLGPYTTSDSCPWKYLLSKYKGPQLAAERSGLFLLESTDPRTVNEQDTFAAMEETIEELALQEESARDEAHARSPVRFADTLARSIGIMREARLMPFPELLTRISHLRVSASVHSVAFSQERITILFNNCLSIFLHTPDIREAEERCANYLREQMLIV